jgi:hypothetical protein
VALSLVGEVMGFVTGTDLTPTERYILAVIAEQANAKTRQAYQVTGDGKSRWVLHERVGLSETGLRTALQRLAGRGLEVRMPLGTDGRGRPFYAVHGRQTTYQLPVFPNSKGDAQPSPNADVSPSTGDVSPSANGDAQASEGDVSPSIADAQPSPFPSNPLSNYQQQHARANEPQRLITDATDAKPAEAQAVIARIQNEIQPRSLPRFVAHLARDGDLQRWVDDVRAAATKAELKAINDARRRAGPCQHGENGGDQLHPVSGEPWCARCRQRHRAERLNGTARIIPIRTQEVS